MVSVYFRHDVVRPHQDALIKDICEAVEAGKIILCHAPTGMGKTDASLSAVLTYAVKNNCTALFLTPKISQHKIAVESIAGMMEKYELDARGCDIVGKRHLCTDPILSKAKGEDFYLACQKKRKDQTCPYYGKIRGYGKANEVRATALFEEISAANSGVISSETALGLARENAACGYELALRFGEKSSVIIGDYSLLFVPKIREHFLKKTGKKLSDLVIVVDEAHNVASRVREHLSSSINSSMLSRAAKEAKSLGSPLELRAFSSKFDDWAEKKLGENKEVETTPEEFLALLPVEPGTLSIMLADLGVEFTEKNQKANSALLKVSEFVEKWMNSDASARILRKNLIGGYSLSKRCLDPGPLTQVINQAKAAVLMSGTLVPLEMHRDLLHIDPERVVMQEYASPFSRLNRLNIIADGFTTKFTRRDESEYRKIGEEISKIVANVPGKTGVFFPAFGVMKNVLPFVTPSPKFLQTEEMSPKNVGELFTEFVADSSNSPLYAVQGGSLTEGMDFPNGVLKCAIMVGIPLQEMGMETEALIDYYEKKMGKGWEYGYIFPAMIKSIQAAGRCVRNEDDRAVMIYLDERFAWKNYRRCFPRDFDFIVSGAPHALVKNFF